MLILIMPAGFLNRKYFKDLFEKGLVRFFWSKETATAICYSSNALGLKFLSSIDVECTEIIEFGACYHSDDDAGDADDVHLYFVENDHAKLTNTTRGANKSPVCR